MCYFLKKKRNKSPPWKKKKLKVERLILGKFTDFTLDLLENAVYFYWLYF